MEMISKRNFGKRPTDEKLAEMYSYMTADEIAKELGVTINTVRSWLYRIRHPENFNEHGVYVKR